MYKRRARCFMYVVLFLLITITGTIYILDPYQIFHKSFFYDGKVYGKTIVQDAGIINSYAFDSVIIGSSMLENTPAHSASQRLGGHFANLSVSDSDFYERYIILKKVLPKQLRQVIYSMDEHIYLYPRMGHPKRPVLGYAFLYDENNWNDYRIYLNFDFLKLLFNPPTNSVDLPNPWLTDERTTRRFGGWHNWLRYPAPSWEKDFIPIRLPLAAKLSKQKSPLRVPLKLKSYKKLYIKNHIFKLCQKYPQTIFYLVFPPYYRYVHANDRQNDQNKYLQYQAVLRFVVKKAARMPNVLVFAFDDCSFTADIANYTDLTHYKPEINLLILDAISQGKHRITSENIEDYLKRTEKLAYDFDLVKLNNEVQKIIGISKKHLN